MPRVCGAVKSRTGSQKPWRCAKREQASSCACRALFRCTPGDLSCLTPFGSPGFLDPMRQSRVNISSCQASDEVYDSAHGGVMKRTLIIAALTGYFGSIISIIVMFTKWTQILTRTSNAFHDVWEWPLIVFPFILTVVSLIIPFAVYYFYTNDKKKSEAGMEIEAYAFGVLWVAFFVFSPRTLMDHSQFEMIFGWFGVCLSQYIAAKIMLNAIYRHTYRAECSQCRSQLPL
jgi:hypothetical protein